MSREGTLFEKTFLRPSNYFKLTVQGQWKIDNELGINDWFGGCSHQYDLNKCDSCWIRFKNHYSNGK